MPHVFAAALLAYQGEAALRGRCVTEEELYAVDSRVEQRFYEMVRTPARNAPNTVAKAKAMVAEYGETGELRTDLVEVLIGDVAALN